MGLYYQRNVMEKSCFAVLTSAASGSLAGTCVGSVRSACGSPKKNPRQGRISGGDRSVSGCRSRRSLGRRCFVLCRGLYLCWSFPFSLWLLNDRWPKLRARTDVNAFLVIPTRVFFPAWHTIGRAEIADLIQIRMVGDIRLQLILQECLGPVVGGQGPTDILHGVW